MRLRHPPIISSFDSSARARSLFAGHKDSSDRVHIGAIPLSAPPTTSTALRGMCIPCRGEGGGERRREEGAMLGDVRRGAARRDENGRTNECVR